MRVLLLAAMDARLNSDYASRSRTKSHDHVEPTAVEDPGLQVFKLLYDYLPDAVSYAYVFLRVRISPLIRLQPFHPVVDRSQHMELSLRVDWV